MSMLLEECVAKNLSKQLQFKLFLTPKSRYSTECVFGFYALI